MRRTKCTRVAPRHSCMAQRAQPSIDEPITEHMKRHRGISVTFFTPEFIASIIIYPVEISIQIDCVIHHLENDIRLFADCHSLCKYSFWIRRARARQYRIHTPTDRQPNAEQIFRQTFCGIKCRGNPKEILRDSNFRLHRVYISYFFEFVFTSVERGTELWKIRFEERILDRKNRVNSVQTVHVDSFHQ